MSAFVNCPDCDQKVTVKPGKSSGKCPACGVSVSFASATAKAGKSSRPSKSDDEEEKPAKPKAKRKYKKEWDEDDEDDDDRRGPPPKQGGSLLWLWILLGVVGLVVATCAGLFFTVWNAGKKVGDNIADQADDIRRRNEEMMRKMEEDARKAQQLGDTNAPGRGPAKAQPDAKTYPKRKPGNSDPGMNGPGPIYLDDLQPFDVAEGPYKFGRHGALGSPGNEWVKVNGTVYDHGIGMTPPSNGAARASFAVDGQARTLTGGVAINDYVHGGGSYSDLTFTVYKDGKQAWQSKPRKERHIAEETFTVDVTNARVIMLEVKAAGSSYDGHAVWLDPKVTK